MDDDTPNTQAPAVQAAAIVNPASWLDLGFGHEVLLLERHIVLVIDFSQEPAR